MVGQLEINRFLHLNEIRALEKIYFSLPVFMVKPEICPFIRRDNEITFIEDIVNIIHF